MRALEPAKVRRKDQFKDGEDHDKTEKNRKHHPQVAARRPALLGNLFSQHVVGDELLDR